MNSTGSPNAARRMTKGRSALAGLFAGITLGMLIVAPGAFVSTALKAEEHDLRANRDFERAALCRAKHLRGDACEPDEARSLETVQTHEDLKNGNFIEPLKRKITGQPRPIQGEVF